MRDFAISESAALPVVSAAATAAASWSAPPAEPISITVKSAAASSAAKTAWFLLPCFIHGQRTAFQYLPVQLGNGGLHISFRSQLHERKASRTARFLVAHHLYIRNGDVGTGKKIVQFGICDIKRQISNEKLVRHRASACLNNSSEIGEGGSGIPESS